MKNLSDEVGARVAEDERGNVLTAVHNAAVGRERERAAERPIDGDRVQNERHASLERLRVRFELSHGDNEL